MSRMTTTVGRQLSISPFGSVGYRTSRRSKFTSHKLFDELVDYLHCKELARKPNPNVSDGPDYLEMDPRLGEAVMATLAVAFAEDRGFKLLLSPRSCLTN
jgi:hypothetical protein